MSAVGIGGGVRVLLVEDEESYREALATGLGQQGFSVELAADGAEGLCRCAENPPDIVLLDLLLPDMPGTEVCRQMTALGSVPVVILSAIGSELDVVLGLEIGAAGYVTKPFRLRELVARMQAILRRVSPPELAVPVPPAGSGRERSADPPAHATVGAATVDFVRRDVTVGGRSIHLSRREFDLLAVLLTPVRQMRTRDELIDLLWPDRFLADSRTLDTHIHRLRAKLEPVPAAPRYIVTVRGVGFRLDPDGSVPRPTSSRC